MRWVLPSMLSCFLLAGSALPLTLIPATALAQDDETDAEEEDDEEDGSGADSLPAPSDPAPSRSAKSPSPAPATAAPGGAKPAPSASLPAAQEASLSEKEMKELSGSMDSPSAAGADIFDQGVEAYYKGKYKDASKALWDYLSTNQQVADKYGYAEYFLAMALEKLNLTHAALEYYFNVAKNRARPELLPDALDAIERITRTRAFDQELIIKDLLYDTTFGFLREDLRDFVEYYQGLMDYRNGFIRWAEKHFAVIRKGTYYDFKAKYVQAVYELIKYNLDEALSKFRLILASDFQQADVINSARQSIARILFEQKKYQEAYEMYQSIDAPIEKQASVFLEEVWALYYLKNYKQGMGLLYALEAPSFFAYFNPEKYLLKALIYKNLCHYNAAKEAVADFFREYSEAIGTVYNRVELQKNDIIMDAALQEPQLVEVGKFQRLLDTEMGRLEDFEGSFADNGLYPHLKRIYELKIKENNRALGELMAEGVRAVAERLLDFEEQMKLLDYEIGISIYKRLKGTPTDRIKEKDKIPLSGPLVYYPADNEFWSDEMHDYSFFIEDRCFAEERWE